MHPNVDKAARLFMFLSELQRKKETVFYNTSDYARDGGAVFRIEALQRLQSNSSQFELGHILQRQLSGSGAPATNEADENLVLKFKKPTSINAPAVPEKLSEWLEGDVADPSKAPTLKESKAEVGTAPIEVQQMYQTWRNLWELWARASNYAAEYQTAFDIQTKVNQQSDEFELLLTFGNLTWDFGGGSVIDRHLFALALDIALDKHSGDISVTVGDRGPKSEFDTIPPQLLADGSFVSDAKNELESADGNWLEEATFQPIGEVTANGLGGSARYESTWKCGEVTDEPCIRWQPTIVMRKRQRIGLATAFANIADDILASEKIPAGLATLIDANAQSPVSGSTKPGATFRANDEIFAPLPLNEKQKQVLEHVDNHAQTIVQGPPGTGKTHMAAALLSHLLAQGARVLVTAETERALYELKGKLPAEIQELAVSVVSSDAQDMADLRTAIDTINRQSTNFNENLANRDIAELEQELNRLQGERTELLRQWTQAMEAEKHPLPVEGFERPLPEAIDQWQKSSDEFGWLKTFNVFNPSTPFPLGPAELDDFYSLIDAGYDGSKEVSTGGEYFDVARLPHTDAFKKAAETVKDCEAREQDELDRIPQPYRNEMQKVEEVDVQHLTDLVSAFERQLREYRGLNYPWMSSMLEDTFAGQLVSWKRGAESFQSDIEKANLAAEKAKDIRQLQVSGDSLNYIAMAASLRDYLRSGGSIKTKADGLPKIGMFTKQVVKDVLPFIEGVRVNGLPPVSVESVEAYLAHVEFEWEVQKLRDSWNYEAPQTKLSPMEQMHSWKQLVEYFEHSIEKAESLESLRQDIQKYLPSFGVSEIATVQDGLTRITRVIEFARTARSSKALLDDALQVLDSDRQTWGGHAWFQRLHNSITRREPDNYAIGLEEVAQNFEKMSSEQRACALRARAETWSRDLTQAITNSTDLSSIRQDLRSINEARQWLLAEKHIAALERVELSDITNSLNRIDGRITSAISQLAGKRAWKQAVGQDRLDPATRSNLVAYTQAVGRLGKGTGKYAERRRREVRRHLERCRSAVPVWIMPIYKVVEQFGLTEDMFDVVIVDEASQAGVDAIFLQYLAPRVVVIGDDKQVSPSAINTNEEEIYRLAKQYLSDFEDFDAWSDPKRSLFDDANQRYGGRIVLEEHRRCVPEIIGFSSRFIYEPENIVLKPVREVHPGRLAPFKITRTPNAFYAANKKKKTNTVEADALVERLVSALDDPAYAGKTFGVISLLSTSNQADYIQARLLEKVDPEVWQERDLKVDNPAKFQGAERDVMFLSMVQPSSLGERISTMTTNTYLQRYNVAVSRAKDQVWLFHSVGVEELKETDIRSKLLKYAYDIAEAEPELSESVLVPNDELVEPFDSLFEQRVFNRIVSRGYRVVPQFEALGYRLDLVVEGIAGRIAVECDGDYWHSDRHAIHDQARQRDLERVGWTFVRIFESDFYLDADEQMQKVWTALEDKGIVPVSEEQFATNDSTNIEVIEQSADGRYSSEKFGNIEAFSEEFDDESAAENDKAEALGEVVVVDESKLEEPAASATFDSESDDGRSLYSWMYEGSEPRSVQPEETATLADQLEIQPPAVEKKTFGDPKTSLISQSNDVKVQLRASWKHGDAGEANTPRHSQPVVSTTQDTHTEIDENGTKPDLDDDLSSVRRAESYVQFDGEVVSVHHADMSDLTAGMLEILEVEGPIKGELLYRRYVNAGGDIRVTRNVKSAMNKALLRLVRQGKVIAANRPGTSGYSLATLRLPDKPEMVLRDLGDSRDIHEVPWEELRAHVLKAYYRVGVSDQETVMREVLRLFGRTRLTDHVEAILKPYYESIMDNEGKA